MAITMNMLIRNNQNLIKKAFNEFEIYFDINYLSIFISKMQ